jgi:hypothetical protein
VLQAHRRRSLATRDDDRATTIERRKNIDVFYRKFM